LLCNATTRIIGVMQPDDHAVMWERSKADTAMMISM